MLRKMILPLALSAVLIAGCGDDGDSSNSGTESTEAQTTSSTSAESAAKSHTDASAEELEKWQADLDAVGCWAGPVDGKLGPQTEAAIKAFQQAENLEVDGLLGPKTERALADAAAAGETVCTTTDSTTDTTAPPSSSGEGASLSSASYDNTFTLTTCTSSDEAQITLQGKVDGLTMSVNATGGKGTIAVSGGTEQDGVTLNGTISSVTVSDTGSFTVKGTFTGPTSAGEAFTLTGTCA